MAGTHQNIPDTLISDTLLIPASCRERFRPLQEDFAWPLRERGIAAAGISDLTVPFVVGRSLPSAHVVLGTVTGGARFQTAAGEGQMGAGDLWVAPASHAYRYEAGAEWRVFWFHLNPVSRWSALACRDIFQREMYRFGPMLSAMESFVSEAVRKEMGAEVAARAYAEVIGVLLDRELGEAESAPFLRIQRQLAAIWDEVNADLAAPWTVAAMAEKLCISAAHLHRLTLRHHGLSPMAMVSRLRMRRAEAMLGRAEYTLAQIASAVGYETPFAFSRAFKRETGQSPRTYRTRL